MGIRTLRECTYPSPQKCFVNDSVLIPSSLGWDRGRPPEPEHLFEIAGPRKLLCFDPRETRAGIVTCGGLCPGLNDVIRSVFLELHHHYGVPEVLGFRFGYQGLDPRSGFPPLALTPELVRDIHKIGGTILGTSRGPVDIAAAIDNLVRLKLNILFTVGGDGTQRGAIELMREATRRGYPLAVVGIPKTVDNDVAFVSRSFGYLTAVEEASEVIDRAHIEALSVQNGISLVRLMGRHAGFITAGATIANQDVNFTLVPELPFRLEGPRGFLEVLKKRILNRAHAVIVVAEGAGQDLIQAASSEKDASGNVKLKDIGIYLRERIEAYFKAEGIPVVMRYFDPNYLIRSSPADAEDSMLSDQFARHAVHAAMAGKTELVIGLIHDQFVHVPMELVTSQTKRLDPAEATWQTVLAATGQPASFE